MQAAYLALGFSLRSPLAYDFEQFLFRPHIEASRLLGMAAARKREAGERYSLESSMAKLFASERGGRVTDKAIQNHGGYGYTRDLPLERYARDARIFRIYEGSSEIQRNIIASYVLG